LKKFELGQLEVLVQDAVRKSEALPGESDPIGVLVNTLGDETDEAKMVRKLLGLVAGKFRPPVNLAHESQHSSAPHAGHESVPEIPAATRLRLSLRWLRALQAAAEAQKRNITKFLEANGIDPGLLDTPGFDDVYAEAERRARADMPDESLYRARYRRCRKKGCTLCAGGPGHGPYWYRVFREGTRVRTLYIGKVLPPQALGFASPQERFAFLLARKLKELLTQKPQLIS